MGLSETLGQVLQTRPILAYGASYLGGVIATASPCILASIPLGEPPDGFVLSDFDADGCLDAMVGKGTSYSLALVNGVAGGSGSHGTSYCSWRTSIGTSTSSTCVSNWTS